MSWMINSIFRDYNRIRSQSIIDNEDYENLLLVDKAMEQLKKGGVLSDDDILLIEFIKSGGRFSDSDVPIAGERKSVAKKYYEICERIGFYLGGYFTDEGTIAYMHEKYNLTDEQVLMLRTYINSQFKDKILKNPIKIPKETLSE